MYFYFSSDYPAVLKLNGIYYGTIHNSVKSCNIEGGEPPFIEVCPLDKTPPTSLILDDACLLSPPKDVLLTELKGGYMLKFNKQYKNQEFKVFCQQKYSDAVVTAFCENGYKLSIETPKDFYAESVDADIISVEVKRSERDKSLIAVFFYTQKLLVNIYCITDSVKKMFSREVDVAEFDGNLTTVEYLNDIAKHKIIMEWEFIDGKYAVSQKKVEKNQDFDKNKLNDKIIPYAFLEEFLAGGEFAEYLGGSIKENANKLSGFFGEFIGIMPPPVFRSIEEVGLIYSQGEGRYYVEYFTFEITEKVIVNIVKS